MGVVPSRWRKGNSYPLFRGKSEKSEAFGYIVKGAAVSVADDGSGWLQIIIAPVRDSRTDKFLEHKAIGEKAYIEAKVFSTTIPK
jgi:hypothetical protein